MKEQSSYVPPRYIPLEQSDLGDRVVPISPEHLGSNQNPQDLIQCHPEYVLVLMICPVQLYVAGCLGLFCPCYIFGKNAEFLGSGSLAGSCMTHFVLWGVVNALCCLCTEGVLWGVSGSIVACYACGYRKTLRSKYSLQEVPCGDLATHLLCHQCAICQEYREIRERSGNSDSLNLHLPAVTAPPVQKMESTPQIE